jgi:argininosuccinate lyase
VLPAVAGALAECTFRPERMRSALSSTMMATDLADYLVRKGATFREAHGAVGSLVRESERSGRELQDIPFTAFAEAHSRFTSDVYESLSAARSVAHREVEGGTGPNAVHAQLEQARLALLPPPTPRSNSVV